MRKRVEEMLASIPGATLVGHAADAPSAVAGILASRPQAVVLDLRLAADSSGFDVLRAVREQLPGIAFYVLTNFANEAYRQRAEKLGARGFFDKSNEFEHLHAVLVSAAALA